MNPNESATRAKILTNIGVVQYHRRNYAASLKTFTAALEIQRHWLEGRVRRQAMVFDAALTLSNMGKVYMEKGDYDLAFFVFEEACMVRSAKLFVFVFVD